MPIVESFAAPAYLPDLDSVPGLREQWHSAVSAWFDDSIKGDAHKVHPGPLQFYNPARFDPGGTVIEQAVTWNAFPKELLRLFGRDEALKQADILWTLDKYFNLLGNSRLTKKECPALFKYSFRPQNEYCEWRVERDPRADFIQRVTFTSEPPELWYALFGNPVPDDPAAAEYQFTGDREAVLRHYHDFVGPQVRLNDLLASESIPSPDRGRFAIKGQYNIYNAWNTTHGIVHLCAPPNFLSAEIQLAADASILRKDMAGRLLVEPEALICSAGYGGPNRNSDPTIGAAVNAAARLGAFVTLKDPVGLYMDHIDLSGWECPDKRSVADCIHIVRGGGTMIERLVVEVPPNRRFTVSDITIGGERIRYGGQIAECITVKLIGVANLPNHPAANNPVQCAGRYAFKRRNRHALVLPVASGSPAPRGFVEAFASQGVEEEHVTRKKPHVHQNKAERPRHRQREH